MKLELSNGNDLYVSQNNIKLQQINNKTYITGNDTLYGVDSNGTRWRLNPSQSDTSDMYTLDYYTYSSQYRWNWADSNVTIKWESVPPSMRADDTFNFDNFGVPLVLTIFLAVFIIFGVHKR